MLEAVVQTRHTTQGARTRKTHKAWYTLWVERRKTRALLKLAKVKAFSEKSRKKLSRKNEHWKGSILVKKRKDRYMFDLHDIFCRPVNRLDASVAFSVAKPGKRARVDRIMVEMWKNTPRQLNMEVMDIM